MMRLIAATLITFSVLLVGPLIAKEDIVELKNLGTPIPDQGVTAVTLENTTINDITSLQLEIKLFHAYAKDLLIVLTSPDGTSSVIYNHVKEHSKELTIFVTSDDKLAPFIGTSAIGKWKLHFYDQKKRNAGTIQDVYLVIEGNYNTSGDEWTLRPTISVTGKNCTEMWSEIRAARPLESIYDSLVNLCGDRFRKELRKIISRNKNLGYKVAREILFTKLDNLDGTVCSVYSERCLRTTRIPPNRKMNCEHSWPQSKGATGIAKADLHHLYPTMSPANSLRSSYPFCEVESVLEESYGSFLGKYKNRKCFEPISFHRGDLARSMFYFSVRYDRKITTMQETFFRKWNQEDPPTPREFKRNGEIELYQGNRNPFVDHPEFVYLISDF